MRIKIATIISLASVYLVTAGALVARAAEQEWSPPPGLIHWVPPPEGAVPDDKTAVRIAEAILSAMGSQAREELQRFKPWQAVAVANAWEVRGTLPKDMRGGTYVAVIAKKDGQVLAILHER